MKHFKGLKAVLFALALVAFAGVAFGSVKAHAETEDSVPATVGTAFTWSYDATKDQIEITQVATDQAINYKVVVIGKDEEVDKKFSKVNYTAKGAVWNGQTGSDSVTTPAVIKLDDKSKGIKFAENKAAYLFVSDTISTSKKALYTPNVKVGPTTIKKITCEINYAKVATDSSVAASNFITVKKQTADDEELVAAAVGDFAYSLDDGKTWAGLDTVSAAAIYAECVKAKSTTMLVRYKGTDDTTGAGTGVRPSKTIKVKIALEKKAPQLKLDVKKSAIVIKNGFDYAAVVSGASVAASDWKTILPYNKNSENSLYQVDTQDYVPYAKLDEDVAGSVNAFTNTKIAGLDAATVLQATGYTDVYMRKSATAKAPATKSVKITVAAIAAAPEISNTDVTGAAVKITVTNAAVNKYEYAIVHAADYDAVDWTKISFKKFDGKTKFDPSKLKTTAFTNTEGDKVASEAMEAGDIIIIRCQGDAKKNLLPSARKAYIINVGTATIKEEDVTVITGFTAK